MERTLLPCPQPHLAALLLCLAFLLGAQPAFAQSPMTGCLIEGSPEIETLTASDFSTRSQWNCQPPGAGPIGGDWTIWFTTDPAEQPPAIFHTRLGHFDTLTLSVLDQSGNWTTKSVALSEMNTTLARPYIYTSLPDISGPPVVVMAAIFNNGHGAVLSKATLQIQEPQVSNETVMKLMLFAALAGLLLMPVVLDLETYFVTRQSFFAWHIGLSISFAALIVTRSNMFGLFVDVPADWLRISIIMSLSTILAVALMFTRSFVEPGKIHPWIYKWMPMAAIGVMIVGVVQASPLHTMPLLAGRIHALGMLAGALMLTAAMITAVRAKSRAVLFQLFGWCPMLIAGLVQFITHFVSGMAHYEALGLFLTGVLFEGIATVIGVVDRFVTMRRQRDAAVTEARMMERLSERDPLTSLVNRRAVEARFETLRKEGFDTFALIDLDRFKDVNDRFGHQVGDKALVACADAIRGNDSRDLVSVRLGGEEFVVLLRGKNALDRVEALRQSIPVRVANEVEGLDRPVTASMGVIELPKKSHNFMTFEDLYSRADQLLYEAKASGRNRMYFERLTVFDEAPKSRAASQAVA